MSFASSSLRWRRPDRKSSTPFLPGAWPDNSSTQDTSLPQDVSNHPLGQNCFTQPLRNLDHVTDFHRRLSESLNSRPTIASPSLVTPSISYASSITEGASNTALSALHTPETLSPNESLSPVSKQCPSSWRSVSRSPRRRSLRNVRPWHNEVPSLNGDLQLAPDTGSASISPPIRLPLSLPTDTLTFSPDSLNSYFSTSEHFSHFSSPEPLPSVPTSSNSVSPELPPISVSTDFAKSFFPILAQASQGELERDMPRRDVRGSNADSPVLPSDDDPEHDVEAEPYHISPGRRRMAQELVPSAAEMDAFAMSADRVSDASSTHSIPTSFVSDLATSFARNDHSIGRAARVHVYGQSSPSLNSSVEMIHLLDVDEYPGEGPGLQHSRDNVHLPPRTMSPRGKRVSTVIVGAPARSNHGSRASPFAKFKAFGAKLKQAFSMKARQPSSGIGVTTTTAVTEIEYKSEHPIPAPKCRRKNKDLLLRQQHRKSMPVSTHEDRVFYGQRRPFRPVSFLSVDPGPRSKPSFSASDDVQSTAAPWISRQPRSRSSLLLVPDSSAGSASSNIALGHHPRQNSLRARSKSSPAMSGLSSASGPVPLPGDLNKSRLAALKNTVLPHPPLPEIEGDHAPYQPPDEYSGIGRGRHSLQHSHARPQATYEPRHSVPTPPTTRNLEVIERNTSDSLQPRLPTNLQSNSATSTVRACRHSLDTIKRKSSDSQNSKRRYRGFSFTKRSSKVLASPATPVPSLPSDLTRDGARSGRTLNALLKGLTPQKKAEYLRHWQQRVASPVGCAEYDPDIILDTMSFADIHDSTASTTTMSDSLISPDSIDVPVHAIHVGSRNVDFAAASSTGDLHSVEEHRLARDKEEHEEERGFLRALGLEFDLVRATEEL